MNNIILFILLILLLFYYINKEYENYENNGSLGIYSTDTTSNIENKKLETLFEISNDLRTNKNKKVSILREKLNLRKNLGLENEINYYNSDDMIEKYYDNKNIFSTIEQQKIELLINEIQEYKDKDIQIKEKISSLIDSTTENYDETLQNRYLVSNNNLDISGLLGIYSSAATLDRPIVYNSNEEDEKLKDLLYNDNKLIIKKIIIENKLKKSILKENKENKEHEKISILDLIKYYIDENHEYSRDERELIKVLIIKRQEIKRLLSKNNSSINSLIGITFRTENERLQVENSKNHNELEIIYKTYESTNEKYDSINEYENYKPDIPTILSNKLKYKSNDEFNEGFNKEFLKINI